MYSQNDTFTVVTFKFRSDDQNAFLCEKCLVPLHPERLGRSSLGPSAPACILRYESSLGKTREGAPSGSIVAVVLSLQTLGQAWCIASGRACYRLPRLNRVCWGNMSWFISLQCSVFQFLSWDSSERFKGQLLRLISDVVMWYLFLLMCQFPYYNGAVFGWKHHLPFRLGKRVNCWKKWHKKKLPSWNVDPWALWKHLFGIGTLIFWRRVSVRFTFV